MVISRSRMENPLEGPSWLLDRPSSSKVSLSRGRVTLEPDSTTEGEHTARARPAPLATEKVSAAVCARACEFSPTVRRRRRASPPHTLGSPARTHSRRPSMSGRVLKVLVAKMRLDDDVSPPKRPTLGSPSRRSLELSQTLTQSLSQTLSQPMSQPMSPARRSGDVRDSPAKKPVRFDAPSPNGSTDARVIVSEFVQPQPQYAGGDAHSITQELLSVSALSHDNRTHDDRTHDSPTHDSRSDSVMSRDSRSVSVMSHDSHDSDSGGGERGSEEGRTRRPRKAVTYKEKPLNRKMRR